MQCSQTAFILLLTQLSCQVFQRLCLHDVLFSQYWLRVNKRDYQAAFSSQVLIKMLSDVRSHSGPGSLLPSHWHVYAEHILQRHTHIEDTAGHRQLQKRHCLPQHPHRDTGTASHVHSFSWAGRGRRSRVQHTCHTLQVHKCKHVCKSPEIVR